MATKKTIAWVDTEEKQQASREVVGTTAKGKPLKVERDTYGLWFISFVNGGELPESLLGRWMLKNDAIAKVDEYLNG